MPKEFREERKSFEEVLAVFRKARQWRKTQQTASLIAAVAAGLLIAIALAAPTNQTNQLQLVSWFLVGALSLAAITFVLALTPAHARSPYRLLLIRAGDAEYIVVAELKKSGRAGKSLLDLKVSLKTVYYPVKDSELAELSRLATQRPIKGWFLSAITLEFSLAELVKREHGGVGSDLKGDFKVVFGLKSLSHSEFKKLIVSGALGQVVTLNKPLNYIEHPDILAASDNLLNVLARESERAGLFAGYPLKEKLWALERAVQEEARRITQEVGLLQPYQFKRFSLNTRQQFPPPPQSKPEEKTEEEQDD